MMDLGFRICSSANAPRPGIRAKLGATALLDRNFVDGLRATSVRLAVELPWRRGNTIPRVRSLGESYRSDSGCRRIEPRSAQVCGVDDLRTMAGIRNFGEHGCSFGGWHLTIGWSDILWN
jgi:hypothetical protein